MRCLWFEADIHPDREKVGEVEGPHREWCPATVRACQLCDFFVIGDVKRRKRMSLQGLTPRAIMATRMTEAESCGTNVADDSIYPLVESFGS